MSKLDGMTRQELVEVKLKLEARASEIKSTILQLESELQKTQAETTRVNIVLSRISLREKGDKHARQKAIESLFVDVAKEIMLDAEFKHIMDVAHDRLFLAMNETDALAAPAPLR